MIDQLISFIVSTYQQANKKKAVIAISGGIDSAVSLTLLAKAFEQAEGLSKNDIFPVFLPYGEQDMADAKDIVSWNEIPEENWQYLDIFPIVEKLAHELGIGGGEKVRLGNIMARVRMIAVYDLAKKLDALVCGTENKSEKHLGYFTRFGDGASDLEPIVHLYKTQVLALAEELEIPNKFIKKAPAAGLWAEQTDEQELGFSYQDADKVLIKLIDEKNSPEQVFESGVETVPTEVVKKVLQRVQMMAFKQVVPYKL